MPSLPRPSPSLICPLSHSVPQQCSTSSSTPRNPSSSSSHQRQFKGALLPRHPSTQANPERRARWQIQDTAGRKERLQGVNSQNPDGTTFEISPQRTQRTQRFQGSALRSLRHLRWIKSDNCLMNPERLHDIRTNHATKQYGAKTYYPANIMNILNEKRNKRTDYS